MKKTYNALYGFSQNFEFTLYSEIGAEKSQYKNYTMWHDYVMEKYSSDIYSQNNLINFLHYLKRERNSILGIKDLLGNYLLPLITVFLSIFMTLIFSVISIIINYNNSISTVIDNDYMQRFGYNIDMVYRDLEQTLYSGMRFYFFGAFLTILLELMILCIISEKIKLNNQKYCFYCDYIEIINELINQ